MDDGVVIITDPQEVQHLLNDHRHVLSVCDPEQQLQGLRKRSEKQNNDMRHRWDEAESLFWTQARYFHLSFNSKI